MWGVRGRALSHPRPLVRSGVRPGPTTHWLCVRGVRAWGPVTNPTARALASWLRPLWGRHEGARGGRLLPGCRGVRGRSLSNPRPLVLSGVRLWPTTHLMWVRGVRAWGPVTNPTACAHASWLCALLGRHEGAWGGRLLPGCGASGVGRSPTPDLSSVRYSCNKSSSSGWKITLWTFASPRMCLHHENTPMYATASEANMMATYHLWDSPLWGPPSLGRTILGTHHRSDSPSWGLTIVRTHHH